MNGTTRILIVDDEPAIVAGLTSFLSGEGYSVLSAGTGKVAETLIQEHHPDLILLDWSLPEGAGIDWLRKWRGKGLFTPVIMLTSRSHIVDKVLGLEMGADDFVTKPFEPRELLARIHARLRATQQIHAAPGGGDPTSEELLGGPIRMHLKTHEVFLGEAVIETSKMEWGLLKIFLENPDKVFSRDELLNQVWGFESYPTTRTVDTHMLQLRQKFGTALFETVRGVGYRFRALKKN